MNVSDVMSRQVICIGQDESAAAAARLLQRHNLGALPVCGSDGRLRGMLTDRDITLRCVAAGSDPERTPVREIMSRSVSCVFPEDSTESAAALMGTDRVRRLPVVREGKPVGMLALCDLIRSGRCEAEAAGALKDITSSLRRRV